MKIGDIAKQIQKAASDNAPTILTAVGVAGVAFTAVLSARGAFKAAEVIREVEAEASAETYDFHLSTQGRIEHTWKYFIPAVATGALSITCVLAANHISTSRAAVLASAYSLSQDAFARYSSKVRDKIGEEKEREVRNEVAKDMVENPTARNSEVIILTGEDQLVMDLYTERHFVANLVDIDNAVNEINHEMLTDSSMSASLAQFYAKIGLKPTENSHYVGWNLDKLLSVTYEPVIAPGRKACMGMRMNPTPKEDFDRFR